MASACHTSPPFGKRDVQACVPSGSARQPKLHESPPPSGAARTSERRSARTDGCLALPV
jgi:hypothetical protein